MKLLARSSKYFLYRSSFSAEETSSNESEDLVSVAMTRRIDDMMGGASSS